MKVKSPVQARKHSLLSVHDSMEGVVVQWYPLILQPEQSGGVGSTLTGTPSFEHLDMIIMIIIIISCLFKVGVIKIAKN